MEDMHSIESKCCSWDITTIIFTSTIMLIIIKIYFQGSMNKATRDLTGEVIIITGSNTGIGFETAKTIVQSGAKVILACRDESRGRAAEKAVNAIKNGSSEFIRLDLSDMSSIRLFVNEFRSRYNRLDILVNNAGVMHPPSKELTRDGFESQIGVNHLGHFLLTNLLLDTLKETKQFRVITVSSMAYAQGGIDLEDLNYERRSWGRFGSYSQSKLANILFTIELQDSLDEKHISGKAVCLHPGVVRTELTRHYENGINGVLLYLIKPFFYLFGKSPLQGAQTTLHCIYEQYNSLAQGQYYSDCQVKKPSHKQITKQIAQQLWKISSRLVKL